MLVRRRNPESDRAGRHRLADHDAGPRAALVGRADRAVPARRDDDADGASWSRSPTRSATSCCSPPPSASPSTPASAGRPSTCWPRHRGAARHRLRLRRRHPRTAPTTARSCLDVGWISFYLLWGAAALHPSMRELEQPAPDRDPRLTPLRLTLLTVRVAHRAGRSRLTAGAAPRQPRPARHHRRLGGALRPRRAAHGRPRAPAGALGRPRAHAQRGGRRRWWPPPAARRSTAPR